MKLQSFTRKDLIFLIMVQHYLECLQTTFAAGWYEAGTNHTNSHAAGGEGVDTTSTNRCDCYICLEEQKKPLST